MPELSEVVSEWLAAPVSLEAQIVNGDEAEVWLGRHAGGRIVVHVSPAWRRADQLRWCHDVARDASAFVPEVVPPLRVGDESYTSWNGRLVALFPFVDGQTLDREDPSQVAQAATFLARIHGVLLEARPPAAPAPPVAPVAASRWPHDPRLEDKDLDRAWAGVRDGLISGICHGDYYRRNVLVADGQVRGVIDWHDAYVGPLVGEVAFAAWEFGHDEELQLSRRMFDHFLRVYRRDARHLPAEDYDIVPVAARVKLRENILWALAHGASLEDEYQRKQLDSFWALKSSLV